MPHRKLAARIRLARETAGLTEAETARRMNVAPSTWTAIENGKTSVTYGRLVEIAQITGKELSFFDDRFVQPDPAAAILARWPAITPQAVAIIVMVCEMIARGIEETQG